MNRKIERDIAKAIKIEIFVREERDDLKPNTGIHSGQMEMGTIWQQKLRIMNRWADDLKQPVGIGGSNFKQNMVSTYDGL